MALLITLVATVLPSLKVWCRIFTDSKCDRIASTSLRSVVAPSGSYSRRVTESLKPSFLIFFFFLSRFSAHSPSRRTRSAPEQLEMQRCERCVERIARTQQKKKTLFAKKIIARAHQNLSRIERRDEPSNKEKPFISSIDKPNAAANRHSPPVPTSSKKHTKQPSMNVQSIERSRNETIGGKKFATATHVSHSVHAVSSLNLYSFSKFTTTFYQPARPGL
jgi:microcompartment protein CcmL/EutN